MDDRRDCRIDLFLFFFVAEHLRKLIFDLFFCWFLVRLFFVFRDRRASIGAWAALAWAFRLAARDLCQSEQWQRFSWANKVVHVALSYSYIMPIHPTTYVTCRAPSPIPSPSATPSPTQSPSANMSTSMSTRSIHERARWQNTIWFSSEHSKTRI